jgi:YYY domain-containing protein
MEYGAVLLWWALYAALAVAGLPIAAVLFRRLEGRGAAFALPVSLVVLFASVYWIGRVTFGPGAVALGLIALFIISGVCYTRFEPEIDVSRFRGWIAVFTVAFLFLVAVRAVDPAVEPIGGEKFLDFGLLKTILRDTALPPEDMWFAGEPVQYYYGGHLISAILTIITGAVPIDGTAPRYAYNLALAGFYAALVSTAYGLAGSIAASRDSSYVTGGVFGAFFVGFASNLVPTLQVALLAIPDGIAEFIAKRFANGTLTVEELTEPFARTTTRFYWIPSRTIEGTINEFPLFAWLNGDLHAHMLSTPFLLLLAGVVFAYYLTPEAEIRRRRLLLFGAAPPIAGTIAVVNTWSFPATAGLAFLGAFFADSDPWSLLRNEEGSPVGGAELGRMAGALLAGGGVLVLGAIWVLPFLIGPAVGAGGRSLGVVPDRTGWSGFLLVHGWVLALFALYFVSRSDDGVRPSETGEWIIAAAIAVLVLLTVLAGAPAFAFLTPLVLFAWIKLRRSDALGFESVLFVGGAGLVLLVELIYLEELAGPGRFNTVFKTYMQVWILWGAASGAALAILTPRRPLVAAMDGATTALSPDDPGFDSAQLRKQAAAVLGILLVVSLSMYGVLALGVHFESHFESASEQADASSGGFVDEYRVYLDSVFTDATLDSTAYLGEFGDAEPRSAEASAIAWLDERAGKPTIVTAAPGGYRWNPRRGNGASAPSSLTGVPTVLGWFHERGYRGNGPYQQRLAEVETIYQSDTYNRTRLLKKHDVEYVYAGPAERTKYGQANVTVFEEMEGVSTAKNVGPRMKIYRVDQSELPAS